PGDDIWIPACRGGTTDRLARSPAVAVREVVRHRISVGVGEVEGDVMGLAAGPRCPEHRCTDGRRRGAVIVGRPLAGVQRDDLIGVRVLADVVREEGERDGVLGNRRLRGEVIFAILYSIAAVVNPEPMRKPVVARERAGNLVLVVHY